MKKKLSKEDIRPRVIAKRELAMMYLPNATPQAAWATLSRWIKKCKELCDELEKIGYDKHRQYLLRNEVNLIYRYLDLPDTVD